MQLKNLIMAVAVATPVYLAGCEMNEGPAEEAGENVDQAVDQAGDAMDNAGDAMGDAAERAGDAADNAGNEMQDEMNR